MLADAAPPSLVRKQAAKLLHNICVQLVKSGHIDVPFAKGDDECESFARGLLDAPALGYDAMPVAEDEFVRKLMQQNAALAVTDDAKVHEFYCRLKAHWIAAATTLPPAFSKRAIGASLHFDSYSPLFESAGLRVWGCAIARFMLLKRVPHMAYAFFLMHRYGPGCEFSAADQVRSGHMTVALCPPFSEATH